MSEKGNKPLRILIVENDLDLLELLNMMLSMDGKKVSVASSYSEALGIFEKEKFDIVLTDFMMPGMDGIYLLDMIKDIDKKMPVVLMSAYWRPESIDRAKKMGADGILTKPFTDGELTDVMEKAIK